MRAGISEALALLPMTDKERALVLEVRGVVKNYQGLRPLRIRELNVRAGERVAISGLDAPAAEVFVNLLNGAILPDEGEIRLFGRVTRDIQNEAQWFALLDRVGIVTSRAVLLDGMSVRQNLALPLTLAIDELTADTEHRVLALADLVGLSRESLESPVGRLAPHARMRIHLARALTLDPALILLEHPTATIERDAAAALADTVRDVAARGLTLLAITEDSAFADRVSDRSLRLQGATGDLTSTRGWRRWL